MKKNRKRDSEICKAYKNGVRIAELAKKYGLSDVRISQILKENEMQVYRKSVYKNTYYDCGDTVEILLGKGDTAIIDKEDAERVLQYSWCIGCKNRVVANVNNRVVYLHRFILGDVAGVIDHINGWNRDNRRCNLRVTTPQGNARNKISKNKYGVNGIRKTPKCKYQARITVDYKYIHIGTYETLEEAVAARKDAEKRYFGEYAPTGRYETR